MTREPFPVLGRCVCVRVCLYHIFLDFIKPESQIIVDYNVFQFGN